MKRFMRKLMIGGGTFLAVLLAMVLLAPRLIPTETVTSKIVQEVARATGAEVTLESAELGWRGEWRLSLRRGSVSGTGPGLAAATGSPNEVESYAVDIEELVVVPALLPLLRKQLEVKAIRLSGESLAVRWRNSEAQARGYRVNLTDFKMDLDDAHPAPPSGSSAAPGDRVFSNLAFAFTMNADTLVLQGVPYTEVDLAGRIADRVVEVPDLKAFRSTGTLTGKLTADYREDPWGRLTFEAEGSDIPAAALLEPWAPEVAAKLDCELSCGLAGRCDLRDDATRQKTLDVAGTITGTEGVLRAAEWLDEVSSYLGDRQDLKDVGFKALDHEFRFVQGRYLLQGVTLHGGETEWQGQGWVEPGGNLAVAVDVKLPAGFTPDLGGFSFLAQTLRDSEGRINLPLTLSGRASKPAVGVDLGRLGNR